MSLFSVYLPSAPPVSGSHDQAAQPTPKADFFSRYAIVFLLAALLYQTVFCLINTHLVGISASYLMMCEAVLLLVIAVGFFRGPISLPMTALLFLVFANSFGLVLFQQYFEPKIIRNLMTPIFVLWLGTQYRHPLSADRVMRFLVWMVVLVGMVEFVLPELYQRVFNVLQYQVAIGRSTELAGKYTELTFSGNGTRWSGRVLLSFLGDHRASSIFLETVSMGNFAVLTAAWGLSKPTLKQARFFICAAIVIAILADSRFASMLILVMTLMRLTLPRPLLQLSAILMPLLILMVCLFLATPEFTDDFKGRLGSTGQYLLNFSASEFFGLSARHYSLFVDQGYAYLLHFCGGMIALVLWLSFWRLNTETPQATIFKSLVGILIAANLAISGDSIFAFKWVTVMWFLLGTCLRPATNTASAPVSHQEAVCV